MHCLGLFLFPGWHGEKSTQSFSHSHFQHPLIPPMSRTNAKVCACLGSHQSWYSDAAYLLYIIPNLQLNLWTFFFLLCLSSASVAAGCTGREGGRRGCLSRALRPDLELDLFLFTLQPRREIFKSTTECMYVCVHDRKRQGNEERVKRRDHSVSQSHIINWLCENSRLARSLGGAVAYEQVRQLQ